MNRRRGGLVDSLLVLAGCLVSLGGTAVGSGAAQASAAVAPDTAVAVAGVDTSAGRLLPARSRLAPRQPSATLAVLATPFFPGWGQLYTDNGWRAVLAFGAETFYWSHVLMNDRKAERYQDYAQSLPESATRSNYDLQVEEYRERVRDFTWWSLGALLIIALDAYVDTHLFDFDRDAVPVPDRWEDDDGRSSTGQIDAPAPGPVGVVIWQCRLSY